MAGPAKPRAGAQLRAAQPVPDGAVLIEDGLVAAAGPRETVLRDPRAAQALVLDAGGRLVLPGFVDSHSHPVFAAPRLEDFERRIKGQGYEQIAASGGGILSTVRGVRAAGQDQLAEGLRLRAALFLSCGTTTLEAKSGYGLERDSELKMLRAIRQAAAATPLELVATFLGAHALPEELRGRKQEYLRRVCEEMLPAVAAEELARFVDVFCDEGFFGVEDARGVFLAASRAGLAAKIHAEQLSRSGAAALALDCAAASADHLDLLSGEELGSFAGSTTVACLVPGSNYFLGKPYPPARGLIDAGAAVALATDFNPGTCPCWDMRMILSIACTQLRLTPLEALTAATINGAWALGLGKTHGSLEPGKQADLACFDAEDYRELPYYFGSRPAAWTMKKGEIVHALGSLAG